MASSVWWRGEVTLQRIAASQIKDRTKRVAYFLHVLEDLLGLKTPAE